MKGKLGVLIIVAVLLVAGGVVWYGGSKAVAPSGDTGGKMAPPIQSPVTSNGIDIPALEKELGISIKEIPAPVSTVDTSAWKTYRNEQYGFEVKYPGEFNESRQERPPVKDKGGYFSRSFYHNPTALGGDEAIGEISIYLMPDTLKEMLGLGLKSVDNLDNLVKFRINGVEVFQIREFRGIHGNVVYRYYFVRGDKTYYLVTFDLTLLDNTIQSIFSTLRFFDPKPSTTP